MLRLPAGWVEELSRDLRPEAFATGTQGQGLHVALTYRTELPDLLEQRGHTLQALVTDLTAGFAIEPRADAGDYVLTGSRFVVSVGQFPGSVPGRSIAVVTSVEPVAEPVDSEGVRIEASVSFHLPYEEVAYDVAALHRITEETERQRWAARDQAASLLSGKINTGSAHTDLEARLQSRYAGLPLLLELRKRRGQPAPPETIKTAETTEVAGGTGEPTGAAEHPGEDDPGRHDRQITAVEQFLRQQGQGDGQALIRLLCDPAALTTAGTLPGPQVLTSAGPSAAPRLDTDQRRAVTGAVATPHTFAVAGPAPQTASVVTETLRQLLARGERVLLLAATQAAADDALRALGDQATMLALRIPDGEAPPPADLRRHDPATLAAELPAAARRPDTSKTPGWGERIGELMTERDALRRYLTARQHLAEARSRAQQAVRELQAWEDTFQEQRSACAGQVSELHGMLEAARAQLGPAQEAERQTAEVLDAAKAGRAFGDRLAGLVRAGETARLARQHRGAAKARKAVDAECTALATRLEQARTRLHDMIRQAPPEREKRELTCAETARRVAEARREHSSSSEPVTALLGDSPELTDAVVDGHARRREAEANRLDQYRQLERRWFEASGQQGTAGGDGDLGRQLIHAANLVCGTFPRVGAELATTGQVPAPSAAFDTLVVVQAERVRDSEFLVGAVRARRWILLGDDQAATDLRDPGEEHELLAAAALHLAGTPAGEDGEDTAGHDGTADEALAAAITRLARHWPGEEFPGDEVRAAARRLRTGQVWPRCRPAFEHARQRLGEEPAAVLVRAVRQRRDAGPLLSRLAQLPEALRQRLTTTGTGRAR